MRVIAGELRGRRLAAPAGLAIRPTSDRLRETLFILGSVVQGAGFADALAGIHPADVPGSIVAELCRP